MTKTLYEVLELSSSARQETIRAAYDSLMRMHSAKAQAGDADADNQLKFIRTAYEVLSNPQRKALYDQRLAASVQRDTRPIADKAVEPKPEVRPQTTPPVAPAPSARTPVSDAERSAPSTRPGGFGRWAIAVVMGFFSGVMIYFLAAFVFTGRGSAPSEAFVLVTFLGGWVVSAYLMQKGAISVSKVFSRGFLIGAAEWLLMIPAGLIFTGRVVASSVDAVGSSTAATAGAAIGGGIFAFLTGGIAVTMAIVCLIGFAISYFIGREMKPEAATATRKCPECAELIQPDAKKCRYCGALVGG